MFPILEIRRGERRDHRGDVAAMRPALVMLVAALTACVVSSSAQDGDYVLRLLADREVWLSGEPIGVRATLSYLGSGEVTIWSSGDGPIAFSVTELSGTRQMQGIMHLDCRTYDISGSAPIDREYRKGGSFGAGDPNEAFYRQFLEDDLFRLPPGRWEVTAFGHFATGPDCGNRQYELRASVILTVQ